MVTNSSQCRCCYLPQLGVLFYCMATMMPVATETLIGGIRFLAVRLFLRSIILGCMVDMYMMALQFWVQKITE